MNNTQLKEMINEIKKAPRIYYPSEFWKKLNKIHNKQLMHAGFDNFKRSVTVHYFNWKILMIIRHQLSPILSELMKGNFAPIFNSRFLNPRSKIRSYVTSFNYISAFIYKIYVAFLNDYVYRKDKLKLLDRIEEPLIGNPFIINYKNKSISQDLCNSVHEFYSISENINLLKLKNIAELGAGYGRLAYIFLNTLSKTSYCIIDIPPALLISQEYLSKVFPKEKIFFFRPFSSFEEIKEEFEAARIRFIMAHQIEYLPKKYFNLTISISTLHEMTRKQISNYIKQINRLTNGYFYNKQWIRSYAKDNSYIREDEYPIPKNWHTIYQHPHPIQRLFFEALYEI
ncbi:MAG: putative sugar O-methyltransferase [Candidatus Levybacteria bacterium]|nr:putative sugar O-methyltransferase [Candidatus Levybacteria bacterium]